MLESLAVNVTPGFIVGSLNQAGSAAISLSLSLTLNNFDMKKHLGKILIIALPIGLVSDVIFYFPQFLRVLTMVASYYIIFRFVFGLRKDQLFLVFFTTQSIFMISKLLPSIFIVYILGIPITSVHNNPLPDFLFHLICNTPLFVAAIIAYRREYRITGSDKAIKIPAPIALPLVAQAILLSTIMCELLFLSVNPELKLKITAATFILVTASYFSFFLIWRLIRHSEQEAMIAAQEKTAGEIIARINAVRAQRHDFINHIMIITLFLHNGQKDSLKGYVDAVTNDLLRLSK